MKSGVYQIVNIHNNKRYIGSSQNIQRRLTQHKRNLAKGNHNKSILDDYNIYGESGFIFEIIEYCDIEYLESNEAFWINNYGYNNLYNTMPIRKVNRGYALKSDVWNKGVKGASKTNETSFKKGNKYNPKSGSTPSKFKIVSPDGELYIGENVSRFAGIIGVNRNQLLNVINPNKKHFKTAKGWRNPLEGETFEIIKTYIPEYN